MAMIASVGFFVLSVLAAALSRIVAAEMEAWSPSIMRNLIKLAVGRLPEDRRARFEEEWQSHVNEVPGVVGKILASAGFLLAAHRIALGVQHSNEVERWSRQLERLEEAHSKTLAVVNAIRRHSVLASHEEVQSLATEITSHLSDVKELRSQVAELLSAYSAAPRNVVWNLLHLWTRRRVDEGFDELSLALERNCELNDQVIRLLEADQRADPLP